MIDKTKLTPNTKIIPDDPPIRFNLDTCIFHTVTYAHRRFGWIQVYDTGKGVCFLAENVAKILGFENVQQLTRRLHPSDYLISKDQEDDGLRSMMITVFGVRDLVTASDLVGAQDFWRWVKDEVVPALTGHTEFAVDHWTPQPVDFPAAWSMRLQSLSRRRKQFVRTRSQLASIVEKAEEDLKEATVRLAKAKNQFDRYESGEMCPGIARGGVDFETFAGSLDHTWEAAGLYRFLRELGILNADNCPSDGSGDFFTEISVLQSIGPDCDPIWHKETLITGLGIGHVEKIYADRFRNQEAVVAAPPLPFVRH